MDRMEHLDPAALAAFQDGGLSLAERASAEAHLAECAECRDRLGVQVRAAAGREAPRHAGAGVAGAIRPPRRVRGELLAAAAIGALVLGAGLWWAADRAAPERGAPLPERAAAPRTPEAGVEPSTQPPTSGDPAAGEPRRVPAAPTAEPAPGEGVEPELLALRGGVREVDGKTFRLEGDEWVDEAWTAPPGRVPLPLVRGTAAWNAAVDERPGLARYAGVGPRVLVVLDSLAFRILPAP